MASILQFCMKQKLAVDPSQALRDEMEVRFTSQCSLFDARDAGCSIACMSV